MFVYKFHVGKIVFHHCWPTPGKMRFPTTCQSSLLPLLEKLFAKPMLLCA